MVRVAESLLEWRARERPPHTQTASHTTMDFNSRRITAILENALLEDRATRDATSYACIDPNQRAAGTILAKQDCILSGLGAVARILDVYAILGWRSQYSHLAR